MNRVPDIPEPPLAPLYLDEESELTCAQCNRKLFYGEEYYDFEEPICEDCIGDYINEFKKTLESEPPDTYEDDILWEEAFDKYLEN